MAEVHGGMGEWAPGREEGSAHVTELGLEGGDAVEDALLLLFQQVPDLQPDVGHQLLGSGIRQVQRVRELGTQDAGHGGGGWGRGTRGHRDAWLRVVG